MRAHTTDIAANADAVALQAWQSQQMQTLEVLNLFLLNVGQHTLWQVDRVERLLLLNFRHA